MKSPAGNAPPRRLASPRPKARLDLRRRSAAPEPDDDIVVEKKSPFWTWVALIALFHLLLIGFVAFFYQAPKTTPPPEQFFTLVPAGHLTKGTPGPQAAPKISPATPAPSDTQPTPPPPTPPQPTPPPPQAAPVTPTPPPPQPEAVVPPPKPISPEPIVKAETPPPVPHQETVVKPPKPAPPKPKPKPKLALSKADLTEVDTTATSTDTPPKPAVKKPAKEAPAKKVPKTSNTSNPDTSGLSPAQVAAKLAHELQTAGVNDAPANGSSGAEHSQASDFSDFYLSVRDQIMNKWQHPNLADETAANPEVTIVVEKDGRVPPDQVRLTRSSGNQAYDDSAVAAAKSLGYLLQPLPDGCPPVIHIDFKLTR